MLPRFSSRLPAPADPDQLHLARAEMRAAGRTVLEWADSNPRNVFPIDGIEGEDFAALLGGDANGSYEPDPRGLRSARKALAEPLGIDADSCFLCASTSEAYSWIFKLLCDPGDAILVPRPGYPLFECLAGLDSVEIHHWRHEYVHPRGWRVDLDSIGAGIEAARGRLRAVVLINPNNPTGSFVREEEREAIVSMLEGRGIALIVDEVFLGFPVEAKGRSFVGEGRVPTFVLDGLSKSLGLPQLKLAWILLSGPGGFIEEARLRLDLIADAYLSASTPAMKALPALLERRPVFQAALVSRLGANLRALRSFLEYPRSPHRVYRCDGGWTAIVESPRFLPEEDIAVRLLREASLGAMPGRLFDLEREACFTASLILREADFAEGARRYRDWFAGAGG